jgi:nucleotide-binding universal stress UspA family protein
LIAQSRLADVVIVSQPSDHHADLSLNSIGDLLVHASAPVLVVPGGCNNLQADGDVVLAWNGSAEAAHAMRLVAPLMKQARRIHVVDVDDDRPATQRGVPAGDAAAYLARHGIACELHEWPSKGRRISAALLHAVAELGARFLVMGAYGHSRLRETVLGGVTRELLSASPVPLLLAH